MGEATWSIMVKLISHLDLLPGEKMVLDDAVNGIVRIVGEGGAIDSFTTPTATGQQILDVGIWDESLTSQELVPDMQLGVLDGVWDWENPLFDPFRNT